MLPCNSNSASPKLNPTYDNNCDICSWGPSHSLRQSRFVVWPKLASLDIVLAPLLADRIPSNVVTATRGLRSLRNVFNIIHITMGHWFDESYGLYRSTKGLYCGYRVSNGWNFQIWREITLLHKQYVIFDSADPNYSSRTDLARTWLVWCKRLCGNYCCWVFQMWLGLSFSSSRRFCSPYTRDFLLEERKAERRSRSLTLKWHQQVLS